MKVLSVNCGSSSLKFQMYDMPSEKILVSGNFERIGLENSFYTIKIGNERIEKQAPLANHEVAVNLLLDELLQDHIIKVLNEIDAVGHRVVHGGSLYHSSVVIDQKVLEGIESVSHMAPLHNPANILGIKAFQNRIPMAKNVAVFDTAFHQTMPAKNYLYAVPKDWYQKHGVRRYGFHGTSYRYIVSRMNEILGRSDTRLIICHIGSGASICAVQNGESIDTSMGFTPNAGLMMGTRAGDIDCGILSYMVKETGIPLEDLMDVLNKKSGFLGMSGISSDHRDIEAAMKQGNGDAILSEEVFIHSITKYIAQYYVELGGCDAICFTGGMGERSALVRKEIIDSLRPLGIELDDSSNQDVDGESIITTPISYIPCYVVPTDEEVMIARDAYEFAK